MVHKEQEHREPKAMLELKVIRDPKVTLVHKEQEHREPKAMLELKEEQELKEM